MLSCVCVNIYIIMLLKLRECSKFTSKSFMFLFYKFKIYLLYFMSGYLQKKKTNKQTGFETFDFPPTIFKHWSKPPLFSKIELFTIHVGCFLLEILKNYIYTSIHKLHQTKNYIYTTLATSL